MFNLSMNRKTQNQSKIRLIIQRFPLHKNNNQFITFNLYVDDIMNGLQESIPMKYPCVRSGCLGICYFDAKMLSNNPNIDEICPNCNNISSKIYLDIGLKNFIDKHLKYIKLNEPLNVQINAVTNEYFFSPSKLKNDLKSHLSDYIGNCIIKEIALDQISIVNSKVLDFCRIDKELKMVFQPNIKKQNYYLYSFCKYHPLPTQNSTRNYIFLFLENYEYPLKVRLVTENNREICQNKAYLSYTMINFIRECNSFIFAVPTKQGTEYYVSSIDFNFYFEQLVLILIHKYDWRDSLGRFNGNLLVNQKKNSVFAIGGFDETKNDSLDYITCFMNCHWQNVNERWVFKAEIQKDHHLFRADTLKSEYKIVENSYKFAIKNSSMMLYEYHRGLSKQKYGDIETDRLQRIQKFYSLGGTTKQNVFFSKRFSSVRPGVRMITNDPNSDMYPIINESDFCEFQFCNFKYIIMQMPFCQKFKQKFKHHAIVLEGPFNKDIVKQVNKDYEYQTYKVDIIRLENTINLKQPFPFANKISGNIDNFTTLLFDNNTKQYYLRGTYPFQQPLQIQKNVYAQYLIIQFNLETNLFKFVPGLVPSV